MHLSTHKHAHTSAENHADRKTDRQTHTHTNAENAADRQTDTHTHTPLQRTVQTDTHAHRHKPPPPQQNIKDTQPDRQTYTHTSDCTAVVWSIFSWKA